MTYAYTQGGRRVFDTGKVAIGLRYEPPAQRQGQDADAIQQALLWSQATPKVRPWGKPWWWGMADAVWHLWRWVRGVM